jgi:hypothetical protein
MRSHLYRLREFRVNHAETPKGSFCLSSSEAGGRTGTHKLADESSFTEVPQGLACALALFDHRRFRINDTTMIRIQ